MAGSVRAARNQGRWDDPAFTPFRRRRAGSRGAWASLVRDGGSMGVRSSGVRPREDSGQRGSKGRRQVNLANGKPRRRSQCAGTEPETVLAVVLVLSLSGCSDQVRCRSRKSWRPRAARAAVTTVDMDRIEKRSSRPVPIESFRRRAGIHDARAAPGGHRQGGTGAQRPGDYPYLCRKCDSGEIVLPAIGPMAVAGLSLSQVEEKVTEAYESYVVLSPSVFVRVSEFKTSRVYITGLCERAGVYTLQSDQMTLSCLLTEAGGIAEPARAGPHRRVGRRRRRPQRPRRADPAAGGQYEHSLQGCGWPRATR